ncbi:hypothetical protein AWC22_16715 [Mycobacterium riyadhense]|uniref:Uncharacterized protein n=2 Tax=Mycobacterium riyadhense TaxID=486698 RepID=A0A1X2D1W9_9MYCO|nr:hypothetical protein AWC22_16715 [Mycobacterium riyadhense]VTP04066.1 hypothetical protein BIN_B_05374 [Mycobacterium riyadhense]
MAADTSSPPAASTRVVETIAAELAAATADPISVNSLDADVKNSGTAITYEDIRGSRQSPRLDFRSVFAQAFKKIHIYPKLF